MKLPCKYLPDGWYVQVNGEWYKAEDQKLISEQDFFPESIVYDKNDEVDRNLTTYSFDHPGTVEVAYVITAGVPSQKVARLIPDKPILSNSQTENKSL